MVNKERIIIVAGGSSVKQYKLPDLTQHGYVIGINDSAIHTKVNACLSMDRRWTEYRIDKLRELNIELYFRDMAVIFFEEQNKYNMNIFTTDISNPVMSDEKNVLNGSNSGFCALNLAYQMNPKEIYLLGYDMQRNCDNDSYWYPPYPWTGDGIKVNKYNKWAESLDQCAKQFKEKNIKVYNINNMSKISVFPRRSFEQFMDKIK